MSLAAPKIAILGGGAAGLAAARVVHRQSGGKVRPVVLEQGDAMGGVWNYRDETAATKPMYRHLRTNLPKEIMAFRELPWPNLEPNASFVTHRQVLDYLHHYRDRFKLEPFIRYRTRVTHLRILSDRVGDTVEYISQSRLSTREEPLPRVELTTDTDGKECSEAFDGVFVCNGHYGVPAIPALDGLEQYFRGQTLHAMAYDNPDAFRGQTVLCVGGRASGSDIARELSGVCRHVFLSDSTAPDDAPITEFNVTWVPPTVRVREDGAVTFARTDFVAKKVDTIIFCTGYDYNFPFISESTSNLDFDATIGTRRVKPLFEQLWHATYPNLCFVGLPHSVIPFPLFELQAEAVWSSWTNSPSVLPDQSVRQQHAEEAAVSGGEGKVDDGRVPQDSHYLGSAQWDYCRRLASYADIYDNRMEDFLVTNKTIYDHTWVQRKNVFPAGPDRYRDYCYQRLETQRSFRQYRKREARELISH
jgi:hypothetical protein